MHQLGLFENEEKKLLTIKEASIWASEYLKRKITVSNISYLIQYGRITKYQKNGKIFIHLDELKNYYDTINNEELSTKNKKSDINWHLSFIQYKESERTKHVHRLHPYKGKFIPQLVEYFLDTHTDKFKKKVYFKKGDIVLDPFCGSGTTLVQANELGIHAIGIDISIFNVLISNVKVKKHDLFKISEQIDYLTFKLNEFQKDKVYIQFEDELTLELNKFNNQYFPSPEYRKKVTMGLIEEEKYSIEKETKFLNKYWELVNKYKIKIKQDRDKSFLDLWFLDTVRKEIDFLANKINNLESDDDTKNVLKLILSRTARSCRATTHADLATLKKPVITTYYCRKHSKICKPIFSIKKWWEYYTKDTLKRLAEFDKIRTNTYQIAIAGDSRNIDIYEELKKINQELAELIKDQKIRGIFSSPPYVGLIDYHEQHAYAYEIFNLERRDELEIGPLFKGQGEAQRKSYVQGISEVLKNCKKYLQPDYDIFLVANDKFNLYPEIAELAGMRIVNKFNRPVLNRVEKDRENLFTESIFHLKEK